ncbi:MAG: Flp pilus assembly protein CpaB [Actinomycetota bacterium]|nr:Flp pilus assembly protein CpaB [Actinomycetota bacterium]
MTYRLRNIAIAIVLALVAGLMTVIYVTNYKREVRSAEANVTVYVAAKDIPAGTSGAEIADGRMLSEQEVAKRSVTPGAISSPDQIADKVSSETIYVGEQVSTRRFTSEEARGIRAELTGTKRAIQIPGDQHQLLVGTLEDGDHVDVVASWNVPEGKTNHYARVVLRDIVVLKASATAATREKLTSPNDSSLSVILAITDAQAQKLFWITKNGDWSLQLRPTDDAADSPPSAETARTLLRDGSRSALDLGKDN